MPSSVVSKPIKILDKSLTYFVFATIKKAKKTQQISDPIQINHSFQSNHGICHTSNMTCKTSGDGTAYANSPPRFSRNQFSPRFLFVLSCFCFCFSFLFYCFVDITLLVSLSFDISNISHWTISRAISQEAINQS